MVVWIDQVDGLEEGTDGQMDKYVTEQTYKQNVWSNSYVLCISKLFNDKTLVRACG